MLVVTWTMDEGHALSRVLTPGKDSHNDYVSYTHNFSKISKKMSKSLKAEGFRFVGSTTLYAFMQSTGMVNDHLVTCFRYAPCAKLQKKLKIAGL